ncbi:MAG TPA: ethanolamine ammonia-lyase subunit EutC [Verrucomicrobiae bacterium]|nr:ethanolamine ammonia-lyase subunit EutC [Verrucomicrobiae bacterium]
MAGPGGRDPRDTLASSALPDFLQKIRARTPARILVGRSGAAYRTRTQLDLREAHAAARDAVRDELDLAAAFGAEFIREWDLLELRTLASTKDEYLHRPDWGRRFDDASRAALVRLGARAADFQIAIGDGLSVAAVVAQVPALLPLLVEGARVRGWTVGRTFVIHHCRVGILNEIGETLDSRVVVLLIGERPGLATAESLSAYLAWRPRDSHTDANRNLISNIHARGTPAPAAARRIVNLAAQMLATGSSGFSLREDLSGFLERK